MGGKAAIGDCSPSELIRGARYERQPLLRTHVVPSGRSALGASGAGPGQATQRSIDKTAQWRQQASRGRVGGVAARRAFAAQSPHLALCTPIMASMSEQLF